ncbi:hypothetical protein EV644_115143 [Kribbella orskensis]|uniref:Uncharacterized protein n=1 Tax=Kribbella orskensis TaxID=2512216 RepID=A0ABY2BG12_9ACTN|nr:MULTISPECIES: hypothetical protein [Kribbella]TCN35579.1 hypothetical protein EV642_116143 [Kribbella sp. VKM Ac-2500]TCO17121.1 hypothetical protein EV644_115143 [Kribbella orskensis]
MGDYGLTEGIGRVDALTAPSIENVRTTFAALDRTVDTVSAGCRAVSETLEAVGSALQVITQSGGGLGQQWGGFGMIGLPIVGAMRAVQGVTSQYVKQQTGIPLNTWTDLVASSSAQFEAYLSQLETVAALAERYHPPADSEMDLEAAREDQELLVDIRWRTQAWKQILSRVAQLGRLVDAILRANLTGEPGPAEADGSDRSSGFSGSLQKRFKEVQTRTVERSSDLREWVLQPFVEVRDKVKQLPAQTAQLSQQVTLLEVLLDLEVAEIRACLGEISPTEARIVGIRVAAGVTLPELGERLVAARQCALDHEAYLDRLDGARNAGEVDARVYSILLEEYRNGLASSRSRLAELEAEADLWRRDGQAVLDACADWMTLELDVLAARSLTERAEASADRRALLQRERDRLDEARTVLASL